MRQSKYTSLSNEQLVSILEREDVILSNPNQNLSDKALSIVILHKNPSEVLDGKPFVVSVEEVSEAASVTPRTGSTYFAAMGMAGGLESSNETKMNKDGKLTTLKTVEYKDSFDVVDTKSTDIKNKIREEEASRKKAKVQKVELVTCPCCHSSENVMMTNGGICTACSTPIKATEMFHQKELFRHVEPVEETPADDFVDDNSFCSEPVKEVCKACGTTKKEVPSIFPLRDGLCRWCIEAEEKGAKVS